MPWGGKPLMAIAILGWPISTLPPELAGRVIAGGRAVCEAVGIPLAGGHSIDAPEPIFGLAVTGEVAVSRLKRNNTAKTGDLLYLTKPLGIGILTTAEKQSKLRSEHRGLATEVMCQSNAIGYQLAKIAGVNALTDVTGFALAGHLLEICESAGLDAAIDFEKIHKLPHVHEYLEQGCTPGGSLRNFDAFGSRLAELDALTQHLLCDPQTSGGLLISVAPESQAAVEHLLDEHGLPAEAIGTLSSTAGRAERITLTSRKW